MHNNTFPWDSPQVHDNTIKQWQDKKACRYGRLYSLHKENNIFCIVILYFILLSLCPEQNFQIKEKRKSQ